MTQLFNKTYQKERRRLLRHNMPSAEKILWSKLKGRQIESCKFRRQYSVEQFVIDFYSPEIKLAIEVDGDSHFQEWVSEYDRERQNFIEATGITVIRFTNDDVYQNLLEVCEVIRDKIQQLRNL